MKAQLIFTLAILCVVLPIKGQTECTSKEIVDKNGEWNFDNIEDYIDQEKDIGHTLAYNGVHSCYTLNPKNTDLTCCYIKFKYKLVSNSDTYTSRGCISLSAEQINGSFKENVIKPLETSIVDGGNGRIEKVKDVSVVCSKSSFLKVTALLLLAFLL